MADNNRRFRRSSHTVGCCNDLRLMEEIQKQITYKSQLSKFESQTVKIFIYFLFIFLIYTEL